MGDAYGRMSLAEALRRFSEPFDIDEEIKFSLFCMRCEGTHGQVLRLAKAIDPTCKAEPVEGMPGRHRCSVCHAVWQPVEDQHGLYCSRCGCRRADR